MSTVIQLRTWQGQQVTIDLDQLLLDFLGHALLEATAAYWLRRAAQFDDARPRPTDYHGASTPHERDARDQALAQTAQACRNKALFITMTTTPEESLMPEEIDDLFGVTSWA